MKSGLVGASDEAAAFEADEHRRKEGAIFNAILEETFGAQTT
jgi:hypothetical protein